MLWKAWEQSKKSIAEGHKEAIQRGDADCTFCHCTTVTVRSLHDHPLSGGSFMEDSEVESLNTYPVYHLICESYPLRTQQIRKLTLMEISDIQLDWQRMYRTEHIISLKKNNSQWSTCKCTVQVCYMQQSCIVDFRSVWTKNNFRCQFALQWVNDWVWHT